jgi:hypothetical protein
VQSILGRIQADAGPEQIVSARLLPTMPASPEGLEESIVDREDAEAPVEAG